MERPVQRQRPCGGHEGLISNLSKTPFTKPNMASNWPVHRAVPSSQTERLEEAPRQTSLQARDSWDGIKVSMGPCPERPGVPDCVHYSRTGICGLGMNCHFNHPPNLKQVPQVEVELPERIGQLECQAPVSSLSSSEPKQYTLGMDIVNNSARPDDLDLSGFRAVPAISGSVSSAGMELPAVEIPPIGRVSPLLASKEKQYPMGRDLVNTSTQSNDLVVSGVRSVLNTSEAVSYSGMGSPAVQSQPLVKQRGPFPERPGQPECQYFLKTGDCKYGVACRFHHPKEKSEQPSTWMLSQMGLPFRPGFVSPSSLVEKQTPIERSFVNSSKQQNDLAVVATSEPVSSATMGLPGVQTQAIATQVGAFPERPGQSECQHYLKTGDCKFGAACKYHHPKERIEQSSPCMLSQLGLPVRPGQPTCTFYSRFGICKFGPMCKFDHPLSGINSDPSAPLNSVYARGSSVTNMRGRSPSETSQKFERSTLKS